MLVGFFPRGTRAGTGSHYLSMVVDGQGCDGRVITVGIGSRYLSRIVGG